MNILSVEQVSPQRLHTHMAQQASPELGYHQTTLPGEALLAEGLRPQRERLSPVWERLSLVPHVPRTAFRGTIRPDAATQLERPSSMLVPGTFYWPSAR